MSRCLRPERILVLSLGLCLVSWPARADSLPAGLSTGDWRQIRSALGESGQQTHGSIQGTPPTLFAHEAQLFGDVDPPPQFGDRFGYSVSVSGDTAVVGAPGTDEGVGAAHVFVRSGSVWTRLQELATTEAVGGFGASVAISADTIVVGAPSGPPTTHIGAAYVFTRSGVTWTVQQKLMGSDAGPDDAFGGSVAVWGDTVVVGAGSQNTIGGPDVGAAYVFVRSGVTWAEQQKIVAPDGTAGDFFGAAVALDGDTAVMGAAGADTAVGADTGAAYVFVRSGTTWAQQHKFVAADGASGDLFGDKVAVSQDTAVVGARWDDTPAGSTAGSAYVFVRSGTAWTQQQKLVASDAAADHWFGSAVSVWQDTVIVGASAPQGTGSASAYVFVRSGTTWSQQQKLSSLGLRFGDAVAVSGDTAIVGAWGAPTTGSAFAFVRSGTTWTQQQHLVALPPGDAFGAAVSVSGGTVVIGAPTDDTAAGPRTGSAYVFVRSGLFWNEQQKLVAPGGARNDLFGSSVSVSGDTIVVGAPFADVPGVADAGAAYVFVRSGTTWTLQQKLLASDGLPADSFGHSVAVSSDTLVIGALEDDATGGGNEGSAYVFVRSGTLWSEQQKLTAADASPNDAFGTSVSISTDTVVVGAPQDDTPAGMNTGSAYVFVRSGTAWAQQQRLGASDGAPGELFGSSVAISGESAAIGARRDDTPAGQMAGSAYVFVRSGTSWAEQQKLQASDGAPMDELGYSVSISGDTVVAGARADDTPGGTDAGSAYVFVRSGTSWSEQQKLLAPDGAGLDFFGSAVSVSGDTAIVGAADDDTADGADEGSTHVFTTRADLAVSKTDGQGSAVPGLPLTYTIVATNVGPAAVAGATVTDTFPATFTGVTWTCSAAGGATCTPAGAGNINDAVALPAGGTVTYTATGTLAAGATGFVTNAASVAAPPGAPDPNLGNNTSTDVDVLIPETDLGLTQTDSADPVSPGDSLTYTLTISQAGPSNATSVPVTDTLPVGVSLVSSVPGPPTCTPGSGVVACTLGPLAAGATATVTINTLVRPSDGGVLVNVATVGSSEADPDPANNSATATTIVRGAKGELRHGDIRVLDLAAQGPAPDQDVLLISQEPYSSYEVVVDATSGDIGAGTGMLLERMGPDGSTVLQTSLPSGTGPSRSLRWRNAASSVIQDQTIRVRSASCGSECGPDDVYRVRAYETTSTVARFNNSGTQVTVLLLQNPSSETIAGEVYFWSAAGVQVGVTAFNLAPRSMLVLNTATVPGANGALGTLTIAHDGPYGVLAGKTVALEPLTGFSFDSLLEPRPR